MTGERVIEIVFEAIREAEAKHPSWPEDPIHAAGILCEEAGELMQAAIDWTYKKNHDGIAPMEREAAQCAAMGIRFLLGLANVKQRPSCQKELILK